VQGAISGAFAVLICMGIFAGGSFLMNSGFGAIYSSFSLSEFFVRNIFIIFGIQLLTGVGLGVVSSIIAIRRYLRV
jgi:cell division transport system permease protein